MKISNLENQMFYFMFQHNPLITENFEVFYLQNYTICAYSFYMILTQCILDFRNMGHILRFDQVNSFLTIIYCSNVTWPKEFSNKYTQSNLFFRRWLFRFQLEIILFGKVTDCEANFSIYNHFETKWKNLLIVIWYFAAMKCCLTLQ